MRAAFLIWVHVPIEFGVTDLERYLMGLPEAKKIKSIHVERDPHVRRSLLVEFAVDDAVD